MADSNFERIRSAVIDGRAQAPRYIQRQLLRLHDALRENQAAIRQALLQDCGCSGSDIDSELYLTSRAIRQEYEALDVSGFLEEEYSLARRKDNLSRRVATGAVYIIPCQHSRLYSTLQPAAAAIAAGNCVIVELSLTVSRLNSLLRKVLQGVMDKDTFVVLESRPDDPEFFAQNCVIIDGTLNATEPNSLQTVSASATRAIAVVDRTANVAEAAKEVVRARLNFQGKSPYSPDLVLVNEFVLKDFCTAAVQYATRALVGNVDPDLSSESSRKPKVQQPNSQLQKEIQQYGATTLVSGSRGSVVLVQDRNCLLLTKKISEPALLIHAIRSLDDAIDLANSRGEIHLAAYFFADLPTTKYLSQFVKSRISFANHAPTDLLVGPAAPAGFATSVQPRYTQDMFSRPSPEQVSVSPQHHLLVNFLDSNNRESQSQTEHELSQPFTPMNEPSSNAMGFFEQGFVTGGVLGLASILTAVTLVVRYGAPVIRRK
ncbi:Aldehyde/histidinol dehydrogenase [Exophiala viscosa]|uniref:Aldehyde/histidinol dehydrogenase n=1 Tax=Exophiala viscosa TaxID=2486360 RepID=A0AAN6E3A6_9EURO|nr:Aldehyde/histidinol dehydrogenase [Exophiala viscosa]KAI1630284.1 Aldehyde/histidinol dehydrogenase [Exophiala viscosa]